MVACLITPSGPGERHKEIRSFRTTTQELLRLADWLTEAGCSHVAMEATGVYWRPIFNLLEGLFELLVVNAQHSKAVPGRKTDAKDAEWIADLLQHGLLRGSYIPETFQRELRELPRYRASLIQDRVRMVNRLQKTLEDTHIKLGDVVSDIMGQSARDMLEALLAGQTDPTRLAKLARGRMKAKHAQLEEALVGTLKPHHTFLLSEQLAQIDSLEEAITRVSLEITRRMHAQEPAQEGRSGAAVEEDLTEAPQGQALDEPIQQQGRDALTWKQAVELLDTIPGINARVAEGILAEIGIAMSRFPSAKHLASWAGMCPGNHESAGKRLSGKARKGSPWLRKLLMEAAHGATHRKDSYLRALYWRIAARRGNKKALFAVAHAILGIIYYVLSRKTGYEDLGENHFDERERQAVQKRLVRRLEKLGYQVSLEAAPPAA